MNRRRNPLEQLHLRQQLLTREAVIFIGLLKGLCFASLYTTVLSPVGFHYLTFLAYHLTASQSICPPVLLSVKLILCIHLCSHLLTFNVFFFFLLMCVSFVLCLYSQIFVFVPYDYYIFLSLRSLFLLCERQYKTRVYSRVFVSLAIAISLYSLWLLLQFV